MNEARETDETGVVVWEPLEFGDYVLGRVTEFPEDYGDYLVTDGQLGIVERGNFTIDRDNLDHYRVVYPCRSRQPEAGSITINYFTCTVETMDAWSPDLCAPMEGPLATEIIVNDAPSLTLAESELLDTGVRQWSDLPVAETEDPSGPETGFYLLTFDVMENSGIPSTEVTVEGAEWIDAAGAYGLALTPSQPQATINYYLTNVDEETTGSIQVVGATCPFDGASDAECDVSGEIQLPGVMITVVEAGDVLTESNAELNGSTYVWTNLPFGLTWVLSTANVIAPDGFAVSHIVEVNSGSTGSEVSVVLEDGAATGSFRVYLTPLSADDDAWMA